MPVNQNSAIDELNWRILEILQKRGRASYAEIGREVGLSAPAVTERVQKMEDAGIIQGYQAVIDPEKLGYSIQTIISLQVNRDYFTPTIKKLEALPEVLDCYRTTGTSALILIAAFTSMQHMQTFLDELLQIGEPVSSIVLSHPIRNRVLRPPEE